MSKQSIKAVYEKRIVAFLDILGFSTMIEDSKVDTTLRTQIKNAMEIIYRVKEYYSDNEGFEQATGIKVTTFSDSIIISYPANKEDGLFLLLINIIHLQLELGALGIMIRGGIAIGDVYHDGRMVFGPAMNEAYMLESRRAVYPRVVIFEDTLKKGIAGTADHSPYGLKYDLDDIYGCIKNIDYENGGKSDFYFVDFLTKSDEIIDFGDEYYDWLKRFRVAIVDGLNRYSKSNGGYKNLGKEEKKTYKSVFKKYRWMLKYWNSVVLDDDAYFPVPDIEKEYQVAFRENYKKLVIKKQYPYY